MADLASNASTLTINGTNFDAVTPGNNTVTFTPGGTGTVTASTATSLTVTGLSGLAAGELNAVVTTNGQTSGAAVQVATVGAPAPVPGDPDPLDLNIDGSGVYTTAVQPDGKTIIGGSFTQVLGQPRNNIARLNADGTLDAGFNPNANRYVLTLAVQADGKILLGGDFTNVGGTTRRYVARLNANGTLDAGFDLRANDTVQSVAVQADGQILLGGFFTFVGGTARNRVARVAANGALDADFNPNANRWVNKVVVQADGQILLGGDFTNVGGIARNRIARVAADGTLDTGFDPDANGLVLSVTAQADGQILLGGNFTSLGGTERNHIARLAADGTLDAGFNPNANDVVDSMAVQADGQILLGGRFTNVGGSPLRYIVRLNANGTLDRGFNPNVNDWVVSVALQADGQILLGGLFTDVGRTVRLLFARLVNEPATQSLTMPGSGRMQWLRGGASPEVELVNFELSTDGGTNYSALGAGTRISGGWELTGLTLPASGHIRARGRTGSGNDNGSLVETVASLNALTPHAPEITLSGNSVDITSGDTTPALADHTDFGSTAVSGGSVARTFTITNSGTAVLNLTGTPRVVLSGSAAFSVTQQPASATVAEEGSTQTFQITFDPAFADVHNATVSIANDDVDENPFTFALTGTGLSAEQVFTNVLTASGLTGDDVEPDATPFDDEVENLLKYAFNMNLSGADSSVMTPGGGSGLPAIDMENSGTTGTFRFEFVRRKNSGLIYTPKTSLDLSPESWEPITATPTVTSIDATWERVVYEEPVNLTTTPSSFAQVEVILSAP